MSAVVQAARGWIGTPYVHQGSAKGAGTDCLGLVRGVWRELCGAEPEVMPAYTPDWGEAGGTELLLGGAGRLLRPAPDERPGDVLVFRMRAGAVAKHMGILAEIGARGSFIHAYDRHGVVESPLSAPWRARIAGRFRFPPR
ncbi:putative phage cell wall peptidase, NlpC/P60 family [Paracoccus thiocyanatus]|uniref:Putative phage cell wall peptidase, NlpC/P60 family n=1 Tax=Paracoccus thiocyanatus TaxID=34006 RepID=A0A1N6PL71_9RHOB|nr:NlpC/P60 family protein [Paracoccus thiocyanatus]SIQ05013.1 putative phage cell wall peptidase, NlpC/P60 family [Paracoccus thiocyanatus]